MIIGYDFVNLSRMKNMANKYINERRRNTAQESAQE